MNVTEQMTTLGKRLDGIENRLDKMETRLDTLETKVDRLTNSVRLMQSDAKKYDLEFSLINDKLNYKA